MDICEKVAYIKGLAECHGINTETDEGKILAAIIDLLGDITKEICDVEDGLDDISEQLDAVDEDLSRLEDVVYDDECGCGCCDDEEYEIECPNCHDIIYLDGDMLEEDGIECPNCGTPIEFDFDGCDCCHCEEEEAEEDEAAPQEDADAE